MAQVLDVGARTVKRDIAFLRSIGLTIHRSRRLGGLHLDLPASAATDVGKALYNMTITLATAQQARPCQPEHLLKPMKARQAKQRRAATMDTKRRDAVLACVTRHYVVKRATVATECHLSPILASRYLKELCEEGKLVRHGEKSITTYALPRD
jgi:ribosomal protein S25